MENSLEKSVQYWHVPIWTRWEKRGWRRFVRLMLMPAWKVDKVANPSVRANSKFMDPKHLWISCSEISLKPYLLHIIDPSYIKHILIASIYMTWPKTWVWWKGLGAPLSVYSLKVLKIACVLVRAAQNIGLVEWLDLVVKVGSVYPTTASTQQSTVLHLCARHSPPFQTDKEVFSECPILCVTLFFYIPLVFCGELNFELRVEINHKRRSFMRNSMVHMSAGWFGGATSAWLN